MSDEEVLERAIVKAIEGGWNADGLGGADEWNELPDSVKTFAVRTLLNEGKGNGYILLIFEYDFAKSLWGEEDDEARCADCGTKYEHNEECVYLGSTNLVKWIDAWQYHLQQMVVAENRLEYLRDNM